MHSACTPNSKVYSRNLVQLSNTSMYSHTAPGTLQGSVQCPLVHSKRHEQDPQQLAQCISNSKGRLMNSFFPKTKSKIFIDCCVLCYVFSRLLIVDCCFFVVFLFFSLLLLSIVVVHCCCPCCHHPFLLFLHNHNSQ